MKESLCVCELEREKERIKELETNKAVLRGKKRNSFLKY